MESTKLSSKGQIVIPKELRDFYNWQPGLEFIIMDTGDGLIIRPKRPFPQTTLADVAGSLPYDGPPLTLEEMEQAIKEGVEQNHGRR
jgi:AbrB family looped-hinge helix DNA binding protein